MHGVLAKLPSSTDAVKTACAPLLLELLIQQIAPTLKALKEALGVVLAVDELDLSGLDGVVAQHCRSAQDDLARWGVLWLVWACRDSTAAVDSLEECVRDLPRKQAYELVLEVCHRIHEGVERAPLTLRQDLPALKRLVPIVYDFIAPKDDIDHEDVFTPGRRDNAQEVRSHLIKWISNMAGPDAVAALREIAEDPRVAPVRDWILHQADERAAANADLSKPDVTDLLVTLCREYGIAARDHLVTDPSEPSIVKILFVGSNPRVADLEELALDDEARDIENKMRATDYRDAFLFKSRWAVRPLDLQQIFLEERPTIVHFSGHGAGVEGLVFHSDEAGEEESVCVRHASRAISRSPQGSASCGAERLPFRRAGASPLRRGRLRRWHAR